MIQFDDKNFKPDLERRYQELKEKLTAFEGRYFHLNTLENLIHHFDEIKIEEDRVWTYLSLCKFLEANNNHLDDMTREKASELFNSHLLKVIEFYREHHSFALLIDTRYLVPFYLILFVILYFTTLFLISLIPVLLFLFHYLYNFNKYRLKWLYGLFF